MLYNNKNKTETYLLTLLRDAFSSLRFLKGLRPACSKSVSSFSDRSRRITLEGTSMIDATLGRVALETKLNSNYFFGTKIQL